jgi:hypothetical protein
MPWRAAGEPYTRKQHDEVLLEMHRNLRAEHRLIELSRACIARSRKLLAETEPTAQGEARPPKRGNGTS